MIEHMVVPGLAEIRLERLLREARRGEKSALSADQWNASRDRLVLTLRQGVQLAEDSELAALGLLVAQESAPNSTDRDSRWGWNRLRSDAMADLEQIRRDQKAHA